MEGKEVAMDKVEGKAKEAYGAIIGDEAKKAEGRAQQRKAEAEKERDRQRLKDKGLLDNVGDTLPKL